MPNRVIKESLKTNELVDSLTWFEEVVFIRLIVTADDYGCMDGRPQLLKSVLFPLKDSVTTKSIESAIAKLVKVGLLRSYTANGKPYVFFPTWEKHQRLRNKRRKYPVPPETDTCQSFDSQLTDECRPESEVESEVESESQNEEYICAERQSRSAPTPSEYGIPLNNGKLYYVPVTDLQTFKRLYPAVDVEAELRGMIGWCMGNPAKRKTSSGVKAFITRWLKRAQDQGGTGYQAKAAQPVYAAEDDFY